MPKQTFQLKQFAASAWLTKAMLEQSVVAIRRLTVEQLRRQVRDVPGLNEKTGSEHIEIRPFRNEYQVRGHGLRRLAERLGLVSPRTTVVEGEQLVLSVWGWVANGE